MSIHNAEAGSKTSLIESLENAPLSEDLPPVKEPRRPDWVRYAGQVLHFKAYFEDIVPNSPEESYRIGKLDVYHYLEDGTTQIQEQTGEDGILQRLVLKRMHVPRHPSRWLGSAAEPSQHFLCAQDFRIGSNIHVYGRKIYLVDADKFTREFYLSINEPQSEALPIPPSPIEKYREAKAKPSGLSRSDPQSPSRFAESLLGRAPSTKNLQQFLTGNTKVLCFLAIFDNQVEERTQNSLERQHFKIHFYLEDNTVEVVNNDTNDNRRDSLGNRFLKRSRFPRTRRLLGLGDELSPEDCIGPQDLCIGTVLNVYGRSLLIYDADKFTKNWYESNFGISSSEMVAINVSLPTKKVVSPKLPPHNGFGDPEDSKQNCLRLVPTPPKKRYFNGNTNQILRFAAKFDENANINPPLPASDKMRRFIVSFSLKDKMVLVYEPPIPNSGIRGGRYFGWGKAFRTDSFGNKSNLSEEDLRIDASIEIAGRSFKIENADDATLAYLDAKKPVGTQIIQSQNKTEE